MSAIEYLAIRQRLVTCDDCLHCREIVPLSNSTEDTVETINAVLKPPPAFTAPVARQDPPALLEDGTLVYPQEGDVPPVPPGYKQGDDVWTFVRIHPLCKYMKLRQVLKESCDCYRVIHTCVRGEPETISEVRCNSCPRYHARETIATEAALQEQPTHARPSLLDDGTIVYLKQGWEPPAIPNGYQRKSNDLRSADAWVFIPVLPQCRHRRREIRFSQCGNAKIIYFCALDLRCVESQCHDCEARDGVQ